MFLRPHSFLSLFGERKELPRPVKKRKETTREPFGWFSGLSIDQSLALDLRRMEVGAFTIDFVGADVLIGPQAFVLLCSCTERRCAERRDLSEGRD